MKLVSLYFLGLCYEQMLVPMKTKKKVECSNIKERLNVAIFVSIVYQYEQFIDLFYDAMMCLTFKFLY